MSKKVGALVRENYKHKLKNFKLQSELECMKRVVSKRSRDILNEMNDIKESASKEISNLESKLLKSQEKLKNSVPIEKFNETEKKLKLEKTESKLLKNELFRSSLKCESAEEKIQELSEKLKTEQTKNKSKSRQVKRCRERIENLKLKVTDCKNQLRTDKEAVSLYYEGIIQELDRQILDGKSSVEEKERMIESMKTMDTKHKGIYNSEIRLLYYDILTKGVPSNIIQDVVRTVLDSTYVDANNLSLPSRSTAQRMVAEAGQLCTIRLAVEKAKSGAKLAHQSDGTTKVQLHWLSHVLKLCVSGEAESKSFTLSVNPATSSTAQETIDDLKNHLQKLEEIAKKLGITYKEDEYKISEINSRMSDRANTEKAVTRLMMEEKERELGKSADWAQISDEERQDRIKIYAFTCGNHKINNTAEAMTKASADFLYKSGELCDGRKMRGAKQHIYECDKLLCQTSKKEYAKGMDFKCFSISTEEDTGSDLFKPIVGSRYLVFLYNSIPTVVGRNAIISFLETVRDSKDIPTFNKIESSVFEGFFDEKIVSEECAFAIMYHEICHPLMVKVKCAASPLSMNPHYKYAVDKMREWEKDSSCLLQDDDREDGTSHASEHLEGGEYFSPTEAAVYAGKQIGEAHNDKLESKFGMLDRRLEFAPSSNYYNVGCYIKAKSDKPHIWLKDQTPELREAAVSLARSEGAKESRLAGTRLSQASKLYQIRYARNEEKIRKRRLLREKKEQKKLQEMNKYGIWKSVNAVESMLQNLKGSGAKMKAIKFQISFLKSYLKKTNIRADLFKFSESGRSFSFDEIHRK
ncbi:hypothetical protein FSP39_015705 [Pinctada imbricata]|uniref:Uncharacterized protein n=1 Tax=Pinctada imbricata TaxID=66713 RepID=A0AA88YET3_PINIB|nr:hypothetical protein FSP39_015705 [Pinctada imbricata]